MSTVQSSPFVRAARWVGDFGNPFYEEERHRDVWNEASAFGLQLFLIGTFLFATVCIWTVGGPALPYVQAGMVLTGATAWATILYAQRLGVDVMSPQRLNRARMVPFTALTAVLVVGMLRASATETAWDLETAAGAVTGAALALALGALVLWLTRRAASRAEQAD